MCEPLPRNPECLKYILRVHLRVDKESMAKALKQLTVRPFVLLQLLYYLIEQNHEVFRGKGNAKELRDRMHAAVKRYYPVDEGEHERPVAEQEWTLPTDFLPHNPIMRKQSSALPSEKNATPGDGEQDLDTCLFDSRPMSAVQEVTSSAASDPATMRSGAIDRLAGQGPGSSTIQTEHEPLPQWQGKYFSQILPFVIPFVVSGPDFEFREALHPIAS